MVLKDAKKLRGLLAYKDVTHRELADAAGWRSHAMVGHLLAGRKNTVTPAAARRIADRLGVPVEELFMLRASTNAGPEVKGRGAA